MRTLTTPTKARWTVPRVTMLVTSALLLTACQQDLSPTQPHLPAGASADLVGAKNQTYTWVVNTWQNTQLNFGNSYLVIPAHAICDIPSSGYGPTFWNSPCNSATGTVTITAVVRGADTDNPSVQFSPALRFNPNTTVTLLLAASDQATLNNMSVIKYCYAGVPSTINLTCVNEALTDSTLKSTVNNWAKTVTRRIKHFSGYLIAESLVDDSSDM
ncbi:MAG TPA: hypothetical protein VMH39_08280 [Gemmatimonadaceae bacterium]|nr:hypothetical protein [Gemmatimonadaceae bacterium]